MPSRPDPRRPRSAPTATARTRFSTPRMRSRRSSSSMCRTTCGQCHDTISKEFKQSIHGQAIAKGNWQAPVCTDCHGIHSIKAHTDPNSPVSAQNVGAGDLCAAATKACGCRRNSEWRAAARPLTWPAITDWRRRAARRWSRTAPVATARTASFLRAIRGRRSTTPIWRGPAASAIPASRRNSLPPRSTWMRRSRPTWAARPCAGSAAFI